QTLYLLESLKQRHVKSHLVCQPASLLAERALAADIEVFPIAMRGETDLAAARHLHKLIRKFNYDIAHSHTSHAHSLAYLASIGCKTCRLVTRRVDFSIFRRSFLRLSAIKYRRMADYYIAISHKIKKVMVADGIASDRIFVVHSGVDLKRFEKDSGNHLIAEFNLKPDEKVVINVAHLTGHKGQQFLVRAIPLVVKKFPRVRFFIVGEGELLAELKTLAASLGITRELVFTGFRNDVGAFYKIADLFVMSSVQEGLGTAVLDALAQRKTVVATACGGIPEIIRDGETGRLVAPADPNAMADGIIEMLSRPAAGRVMADEGRTMVKNYFSVDAMANKNIDVYERVLTYG
ncbi:MAG: glycosyltransferase family 4 protein, partial [Desulfobacterales bacterium]